MTPSIIASLFYVLTTAVFLTGVYFVKKSDKQYIAAVWIPVACMVLCSMQGLFAAIFSLVNIPVNLYTLGLINGLAGVPLWMQIRKTKEIQKYEYKWIDLVALAVFGALFVGFVLKTCSLEFAPHYLAADGAAHLKMALRVMVKQEVIDMYFSALHHGIFIEIFAPFVSSAVYYKLFVLSDMLHLLFAWCMFYAVVRRHAKDIYLQIAAIIATAIYGCGYPMNSTLFGFTYLGMGVIIISYLLIVTDLFVENEIDRKYAIIMMCLGCFAIFESYVLFMPVVFFSILFAMFIKQYKEKKLISWDTIKTGLQIFLLPTVLGLVYTYSGIFAEKGTSVGSAIANEGGIYRDLYSNFAILIPFVLFALYNLLKERKNKLSIILVILLVGFMAVLFILGVSGKVSSYYFYKNYYLLWMIAFELAFVGLTYFDKQARTFVTMGFVTWAVIFVAFLGNFETLIYNKSSLFNTNWKAETYNDIYRFNRDAIRLPRYSSEKLHLYRYAVENLMTNGEEVVLASSWEDFYWMDAITYQNLEYGYYYWNSGEDLFLETMYERADYIIVLYDAPIYANHVEEFESLEKVYDGVVGYIARVK